MNDMNDDIVARLRGAADESIGCNCVKCEAADEIERLRVIVQGWEHSARNAERDITELRAERDEARRMYCDLVAAHGLAPRYDETGFPEEVTEGKQFARRLRWDCYKEVTP